MIFFINLVIDHGKVYLCFVITDYIHYFSLLTISFYFLFLLADFGLFLPKKLRNLLETFRAEIVTFLRNFEGSMII